MNIFSKEHLFFDIDKGKFRLVFHGQEIPSEEIKAYTLPMDKFFHVAFLYKKTLQNITVLYNCQEVAKFNFLVAGLEINTPLVFGSERFDGEMTEIRIWNQRLPIDYIRENYKTPLSSLAEKKTKLKINVETNIPKKKLQTSFIFGDKAQSSKELLNKNNAKLGEINNPPPMQNNNMGYQNEFDFNNNAGNDNFGEEDLPTMDMVNNDQNNNFNVPGPSNNVNNMYGMPNNNEFAFQENDFNFEK